MFQPITKCRLRLQDGVINFDAVTSMFLEINTLLFKKEGPLNQYPAV